ncbi:AEC family transporter [Breoghania sp. L-A4]|uniref:AEC family transporter n=1 Tax=Breoghania sp. L-A4 TaxID=2304600 RepID=UPI000E35DC3D|nr:AEC family transporter [Breoghania sp. L-A4]AXS40863.1 AEC family transporter [Breoghania sp. L-A4]
MMPAIDALIPVLLVIATGHIVARMGFVDGDQWRGFERLAYYVLFPCIIIYNIALVDFGALPFLSLGATLIFSILTMACVTLALRPMLQHLFGITPKRFTSIFQGAIRWNTFVALAMADRLWGAEGVALIAVAIVAMVPLLNVLSVLVLARYAEGAAPTAARMLQDLVKNPFILSTAIGLAINLTGLMPPAQVMTALEMMGRAALSAGLLVVGASLDLGALRRPGPALASSTLLKLVCMPLLAAGFAWLLDLAGTAHGIAILATAVPSATGSYLLARQMGGDAKLMAEILTLQTILAVVTMPVALWLLG